MYVHLNMLVYTVSCLHVGVHQTVPLKKKCRNENIRTAGAEWNGRRQVAPFDPVGLQFHLKAEAEFVHRHNLNSSNITTQILPEILLTTDSSPVKQPVFWGCHAAAKRRLTFLLCSWLRCQPYGRMWRYRNIIFQSLYTFLASTTSWGVQ